MEITNTKLATKNIPWVHRFNGIFDDACIGNKQEISLLFRTLVGAKISGNLHILTAYRDELGRSNMHYAALSRSDKALKIIKLLRRFGWDPNARDNTFYTATPFEAALRSEGNPQLLIDMICTQSSRTDATTLDIFGKYLRHAELYYREKINEEKITTILKVGRLD